MNGLGSGIRDRCKPEIEIQSNSAATTAEEMSRLGSRLSTPRLLSRPELDPIGPLFDRRRCRPIGIENENLGVNRCADVCVCVKKTAQVSVRAGIAFERESRIAEAPVHER